MDSQEGDDGMKEQKQKRVLPSQEKYYNQQGYEKVGIQNIEQEQNKNGDFAQKKDQTQSGVAQKPLSQVQANPNQEQKVNDGVKNNDVQEQKFPKEEENKKMPDATNLPTKTLSLDERIKIGKNAAFYGGDYNAKKGLTIKAFLQDWVGSYQRLERDHSYIQFIFPNFYESRFNMQADPLNMKEALCFRSYEIFGKNYFEAYKVFLDFLGLEIVDETTGTIKFQKGSVSKDKKDTRSKTQLQKEADILGMKKLQYRLITCSHNQLRMWRILSSLCGTGFSIYAQRLVDFLCVSINGKQVYYKNIDYFRLIVSDDRKKQIEDGITKGYIIPSYFKGQKRSFFYFEKWIEFGTQDPKRLAVASCIPKNHQIISMRAKYLVKMCEEKVKKQIEKGSDCKKIDL